MKLVVACYLVLFAACGLGAASCVADPLAQTLAPGEYRFPTGYFWIDKDGEERLFVTNDNEKPKELTGSNEWPDKRKEAKAKLAEDLNRASVDCAAHATVVTLAPGFTALTYTPGWKDICRAAVELIADANFTERTFDGPERDFVAHLVGTDRK